jgi:hypothetical protein
MIKLLENNLLFLIWILIFIAVLVSKKQFSGESETLGVKARLTLGIIISIFVIAIASSFGWIYYQIYFPKTNLATISEQLVFKPYIATYIPADLQQQSKYLIVDDTENFGSDLGVRVVYSTLLYPGAINEDPSTLVIFQTKPGFGFNMNDYINQLKMRPEPPTISQVTLSNTQEAFVVTNSGTQLTSVQFHTPEDRVVMVMGMRMAKEELIKIAEGLE